jgi:hypothetical protein
MVQIPFFPEGTRVRVRAASTFPLPPEVEGRTGLVLARQQRGRPGKVVVQLDGETQVRTFHASELESLESGLDLRFAGSARP